MNEPRLHSNEKDHKNMTMIIVTLNLDQILEEQTSFNNLLASKWIKVENFKIKKQFIIMKKEWLMIGGFSFKCIIELKKVMIWK